MRSLTMLRRTSRFRTACYSGFPKVEDPVLTYSPYELRIVGDLSILPVRRACEFDVNFVQSVHVSWCSCMSDNLQ